MPGLPGLLATYPNVLVIASEREQHAAVQALLPYLRQPVTVLRSPSESSLPSCGSVILESIGDLTLRGQEALFFWLEGRGKNTQVVSLSAVPLFRLVNGGKFLEDLYYRINTIQFEVDKTVERDQLANSVARPSVTRRW